MPNYDFECPKCPLRTTLNIPIHERDSHKVYCPVHYETLMMRVPSAPGFSVGGFNAANGYTKERE